MALKREPSVRRGQLPKLQAIRPAIFRRLTESGHQTIRVLNEGEKPRARHSCDGEIARTQVWKLR